MSATPSTAAPASGGADPSMEDILASIRRILSEDEAEAPAAPPAAVSAPTVAQPVADAGRAADVLALDSSMLVQPPQAAPPPPAPMAPPPAPEPSMPEPSITPSPGALLGAEASAAAASSLSSLLKTLSADRQPVAVYRGGGPTIEDVVRDELRPLLKHWLDHNLPGMVERLVRAEIERVVGRT